MFFVSLKKKAWFIPILAARVGLEASNRQVTYGTPNFYEIRMTRILSSITLSVRPSTEVQTRSRVRNLVWCLQSSRKDRCALKFDKENYFNNPF